MAEKKEEEKKEDDERLEFIYKYLALSRKIKLDKWIKLLTNEEFKETIMKFFHISSEMILIVQLNPADVLVPFREVPSIGWVKTSYFMKRNPVQITKENYKNVIIPGDMAAKPIEELSVLVEEAYVPILSNPKNYKNWPRVIGEDMKKHVYDFCNIICQIKGKMTGQTLLPMPMDVKQIFEMDVDVDVRLKSNIETVMMRWSSQIGDVLDEESARTFMNNRYPLPSTDIEFWRRRLINIESILSQMRDPRVKKMASILELTKSLYSSSFKSLLKDVIAAVIEARDVCSYLTALESHFEDIQSSEFKDIQPKLKPLLHCVCLIWSNSKYYCSSTRIITLLSKISNLLITQAVKYLDQSTLFGNDIEDSLKRLEQVTNILTYYVEMFEMFRSKLDSYFKYPAESIPWNFDDELVLGRITNFQKRLGEIKMLFETTQEYFKLERMEFAGLKGKTLCSTIHDIYEKFVKIYNEFAELQYDILMPEEIRFTDCFTLFLAKVEQFDRELANIFDQAFSKCHNTEFMFKVIWIIGSIANRPIIMAQLWHNYERLLQRMHNHFDDIKMIFDSIFKDREEDEQIETDQYFPHVAGALCTLTQLRERIDYPMQCVKLVDHPLVNLRIARETKPKYDQLQSLMDAMEQEIFMNWADKIIALSYVHLSKSLLTIDENKLLSLNFDPELTALLREARYMIIMRRRDLPDEAIRLYYRTQYFFESTYKLSLLVQWYNRIRNHSLPVEFELVSHEMDKVDELILRGQESYNWNSPEVPEYIDNLLSLVRKLHSRIFRGQENINTLMRMIYSWAMLPILERKDFKDENLLATGERDESFQKRYKQIEHAVKELNRILDENYKLFFDLLPDSIYERDEFELDKNARIDTGQQELEQLEGRNDTEELQIPISRLRIDEEQERITRDGTEDDRAVKNKRIIEELLTDEEIAQHMIKWKPYLAYVDDLISKALIQAASTRYPVS